MARQSKQKKTKTASPLPFQNKYIKKPKKQKSFYIQVQIQ